VSRHAAIEATHTHTHTQLTSDRIHGTRSRAVPDQQLCVWQDSIVASQSIARMRIPRATMPWTSVVYCPGCSGGGGGIASGAEVARKWGTRCESCEEAAAEAEAPGALAPRSGSSIKLSPSIMSSSSIAIALLLGNPIAVGSAAVAEVEAKPPKAPRIMFGCDAVREWRLPGRLGATK